MNTHDPQFRPPFCPHPDCRFHRKSKGWRFISKGVYHRKAEPRRIRRFLCCACERGFSTQTFDTTYYLKRPDIQHAVLWGNINCSGFRQVSRALEVAHTTVVGQTARLGRHCLLYAKRYGPKKLPDEELVLDGFSTYEYSHYWPFDANVLAGAKSHYFHGFTDAELRRSGRMTKGQEARRAQLEKRHGCPPPQTVVREVEQLVRLVAPKPQRLRILSDDHQSYPKAFARLEREGWQIEHATTSSKAARTKDNPLFPANLLDLLIRHSGSNHKRQTIAASKRRQSAMERLAIFQVWRNFMKRLSEKLGRRSTSPANHLRMRRRRQRAVHVLLRRLFPSRVRLPPRLQAYYDRDIETRQIPNGRRHELKRAR